MSDTTFATIPLAAIRESKTNPRKTFDEKALAELTASIKDKGIINPPIVRPIENEYELVAGARRFRAAKAAGLKEIPAIVRELSDEEVVEIQVVENLQRQDVHPLDEAEGYKAMLATKRYDAQSLAAKVGKSTSYVYQRLALNSLIAEVKKAFWEEKLTLGHASLLARIQADDQKKIFRVMIGRDGGSWSVRRLSQEIEEEVMCTLDSAGFDKKDPLLVMKAGACTVCPKRSGYNKELFNDITTKDRCMDPACFHGKVDAHIKRIDSQAKANGVKLVKLTSDSFSRTKGIVAAASKKWADDDGWRDAKKGCPKPETGVVVEGEGLGRVLQVCLNKACNVCNPGAHASGSSSSRSGQKTVTPAARYKRRMEIWNDKVEQVARQKALEQIVPLVTFDADRLHAVLMIRELEERNHGPIQDVAALVGVKITGERYRRHSLDDYQKLLAKADDKQLSQILWGMVMQRDLIYNLAAQYGSPDAIWELADYFTAGKVLLPNLRKEAEEALAKSKPKPPKKDKPAGKKTKKEVKDHE